MAKQKEAICGTGQMKKVKRTIRDGVLITVISAGIIGLFSGSIRLIEEIQDTALFKDTTSHAVQEIREAANTLETKHDRDMIRLDSIEMNQKLHQQQLKSSNDKLDLIIDLLK